MKSQIPWLRAFVEGVVIVGPRHDGLRNRHRAVSFVIGLDSPGD